MFGGVAFLLDGNMLVGVGLPIAFAIHRYTGSARQ